MILDNELAMTTAVAIDLTTTRSGPGNPICLIATGVSANVVLTTGPTTGAETSLETIVCGGEDLVEFTLPSTAEKMLIATFADGAVNIILPGAQTNT